MSKYIRKRYIDAEALKSYLNPIARKTDCHFLQLIDNIPTADVEKITYAEWIPIEQTYHWVDTGVATTKVVAFRCSLCGAEEKFKYKYCHCGAKMDGEKE